MLRPGLDDNTHRESTPPCRSRPHLAVLCPAPSRGRRRTGKQVDVDDTFRDDNRRVHARPETSRECAVGLNERERAHRGRDDLFGKHAAG